MPEPKPSFEYRAKVKRWIDGDTVELSVDLGFRSRIRDRFRLYGVNTAELRPRKADFESEEDRQLHIEKANQALDLVNELAPVDTYVTIRTHMDQGKYGRWLAEVYIDDKEEWLHEILIGDGLGEPYTKA